MTVQQESTSRQISVAIAPNAPYIRRFLEVSAILLRITQVWVTTACAELATACAELATTSTDLATTSTELTTACAELATTSTDLATAFSL